MENATTFFVDNNTVPSASIQQGVNILWTCLLCIVSLLSCFGNLLVCFTLYRRKYLLTSSNKLVFSLTISNFGYSVLVFPFSIASSITGKWMFGKVWCSLTAFLTMSLLGSSMITLSVISFDRYYAIIHPLKYPNRVTSCRITAVIIVCWSVALCLAVPPLFGAGVQYQYFVSRFGCFPLWNRSVGFSLFWLLTCSIFPMCCMISMYCSIFGVAREKYQNANWRHKHVKVGRHRSWSYGSNSSKNSFVFNDTERGNVSAKLGSENVQMGKSFHELQAASNVSFVEDSGIASSDLVRCSQTIQFTAESSPHEPVYDEPCRSNVNGLEANHSLVNSSYKQTTKSDQFICKQMYAVKGSKVDSMHKKREIQSHVVKRGSSTSSTKCQRNAFHKRPVGFSNFQYYKNQKKACCTITVIVGSVLITMSPFVVVCIVESFQATTNTFNSIGDVASYQNVLVPDWLVSLTTILVYLTCVYYPVIYGLWNETLRHEMMLILRGKSRGPNTRRTRILSLSTHIKDLGLSPRLTAAIMGESVAMAAVVYPMQVDTKASKRMRTTSARKTGSSRTEPSRKTSSQSHRVAPRVRPCFEETPSCSKTTDPAKKEYKMQLAHEGKRTNVNINPNRGGGTVSRESPEAGRLRDREKLMDNPLRITSPELLGSELLQSALLFGLSDDVIGLDYDQLSTESERKSKKRPMRSKTVVDCRSSSSDAENDVGKDDAAVLGVGKLIHLEAGEPIRVRKWSQPQVVDFFAQTLAYDLMEDMKQE